MLSFAHYNQEQIFQQSFEPDTRPARSNPSESYQPSAMDSFYPHTNMYNNHLPFSFAPAAYLDAPADNTKHEMCRTASNSSIQRSLHDMSPALISSTSVESTASSIIGSPFLGHAQLNLVSENYQNPYSPSSPPTILYDDAFHAHYGASHLSAEMNFSEPDNKLISHFVDPNLLSGQTDPYFQHHYDSSTVYTQPSHSGLSNSAAPSPVPSHNSYHAFSQPVTLENYHQGRSTRETSVSSQRSGTSSRTPVSGDENNNEKGCCPDCGRPFRDLKTHMLTHLAERPEKCPIPTCEYYTKGFARRYDKNRHTLTHYRGTMVCNFCPNSGLPGEKLFNRADVFKRHLIQVHNVERDSPNSKKRVASGSDKKASSHCSDATGKCSTCSFTFQNAQEFYDHFDECVLHVVQQVQPSEHVNEVRLAEVASDAALQEIFDRNQIKPEESSHPFEEDELEEDEMEEEDEDEDRVPLHERPGKGLFKAAKAAGARAVIGGNITKNKSGRKGFMTWSKGGVPLGGKKSRRRKFYPNSWGLPADKMKMKKRVICVFDGPRQLMKDDMMLSNEFEVRVKLSDGESYVTDLDVETLKRSEALHDATEEEKGPWIEDPDFFTNLMG